MPPGNRFLVPFPLKQFLSSHPLGILPVTDLQPGCAWQVRIEFVLRDYTFQVSLADKMEQLFSHHVNVIAVEQPFTLVWDQATQPLLPICERQVAQILTLREQEIKGVVARLSSAKERANRRRKLALTPVLNIYNGGVSLQASKTIIRQGWTIDIRTTVFAAIALAVVVAFSAFLHRGDTQHRVWTSALGTIQDTRILPDHALETKWGGQVTWKAEYKVSYYIASREYAVWVDSGIRGDSEAGVALALRQSRPSCSVQYNPERPDVSVAACR